jgi:hypothetical protein
MRAELALWTPNGIPAKIMIHRSFLSCPARSSALNRGCSRLSFGVQGFVLLDVESHCPLDSPITDGTICRCTPFPQPLLAMLLVHMTCLHMTTVIGFYRGFELCYAKMHLPFGSAILRFPDALQLPLVPLS